MSIFSLFLRFAIPLVVPVAAFIAGLWLRETLEAFFVFGLSSRDKLKRFSRLIFAEQPHAANAVASRLRPSMAIGVRVGPRPFRRNSVARASRGRPATRFAR